jgi:thiol-disulfide isomerase/thioredoxin
MAATESNMMALGTQAPYFNLFDAISRKMCSIDEIKSEKATVIMFICNHCPYVQHVMKTVLDIARKYQELGVAFVAISSNDIENYPLDHPDIMEIVGKMAAFSFPYLFDENQSVAKAFDAACTPDIYIFDSNLKLAYRGRLDESRPKNNIISDGKDIRNALDAILQGNQVNEKQYPSIGCNIKWKS